MCKFIHIRNYDEEGKTQGKGGCTIAFEDLGNKTFMYAVARCHEKDNYNKGIGRAKARGRLKSDRYVQFVDEIESVSDFIAAMVFSYKKEKEIFGAK